MSRCMNLRMPPTALQMPVFCVFLLNCTRETSAADARLAAASSRSTVLSNPMTNHLSSPALTARSEFPPDIMNNGEMETASILSSAASRSLIPERVRGASSLPDRVEIPLLSMAEASASRQTMRLPSTAPSDVYMSFAAGPPAAASSCICAFSAHEQSMPADDNNIDRIFKDFIMKQIAEIIDSLNFIKGFKFSKILKKSSRIVQSPYCRCIRVS